MNVDLLSQAYEGYMKLAESGRYQEALEAIQHHLKQYPRDRQGWNDAGAVLYCLRRVEDAIVAFEKAFHLSEGSAPGEVLWNLCEAYLDGGYPGMASRHYDSMQRMGLLTADLLNRTADSYLKQDNFGGAIEMILRSLEISPNQDVLSPMLDVLRSKRPRVALVAANEDAGTLAVYDYLQKRFKTEFHVGLTAEAIPSILGRTDIAWFDGYDGWIAATSRLPKACKMIVRLGSRDVNQVGIREIRWDQIDTVLLSGSARDRDRFCERIPGVEKQTRVAVFPEGVDLQQFTVSAKQRGKNIAYIGDMSAASNPMLLLQCMQKLHYIDPGYRMYIAGTFEEKAVERYIRYMMEQMKLSGVVAIEDKVHNLNGWLQDKHYIVGTGIEAQDWKGVLKGMAAGLRPLVANHPDIDGMIDREYVFDLAEDFCRQIQSQDYDSQRYRQIAESRYSSRIMIRGWNDEIFRLEKQIDLSHTFSSASSREKPTLIQSDSIRNESNHVPAPQTIPLPGVFRPVDPVSLCQVNPPAGRFSDSLSQGLPPGQVRSNQSMSVSQPIEAVYPIPFQPPVSADRFSQSAQPIQPQDSSFEPIPIVPIPSVNLNEPESRNQYSHREPWNPSTKPDVSSPSAAHVAPRQCRSVDELAKEALKASQALADLARQKGDGKGALPNENIGANPIPRKGNVFGSFSDPVRDNRVNQAAAEFSDQTIPIDIPETKIGDTQLPFLR